MMFNVDESVFTVLRASKTILSLIIKVTGVGLLTLSTRYLGSNIILRARMR